MIIILALLKFKLLLMIGLAFGTLLSILKFRSYVLVFVSICSDAANRKPVNASIRSVAVFMLGQLILFPLLYVALKLNETLFAGMAAGMLVVPAVVFLNSITELAGITRNNFR